MNSSFLFYRILAVEAFLTDTCLVQSARVVDTLSRRAHIWIWHLAGYACIRLHMTRTWYTWYVSLFPSWSICTDVALILNFLYLAMQLSCYFLACLTKKSENLVTCTYACAACVFTTSATRIVSLIHGLHVNQETLRLHWFISLCGPAKQVYIHISTDTLLCSQSSESCASSLHVNDSSNHIPANNHGFSCLFPSSGRAWKLSPQQPCVRVYMHL